MNWIRSILLVLPIAAGCSPALAQTMKYEDSAALLGASCAKDIEANCRGVNLDPTRMKDCLSRNQDVLTPQCKSDDGKAFEAIQKRVAARQAVFKLCERDIVKLCGATDKNDRTKALECLIAGPRGIGINCNKSVVEAGYR